MEEKKVAIIVSRWNELITNALLEGAIDELERHGLQPPLVLKVPGAWEIPLTAKHVIAHESPDAIVALGCIIHGETPHADQLAGDVSSALMRLQLESGVPISWGILTPLNAEQALDRAGLKMGNKGREAASAAIESLALFEAFKS